ncbi:uncharacterized protein LOC110096988 [Dendrobium catenatum]|uniref:Uncharacterized protein n=1 Tax=Dendrobium nobile TaxID=94219 RepID=A0A8T3ARD1_DENNO|nr:uncharacterized protein LOC110096988 [Dendrobium catenatum]KAI0496655.1 hypothetical protein KFK09_022977 [Dendrobium nobile]
MVSQRWAYVRIVTGTILGGVLGFYVMHRVEISYKERRNEEIRRYQNEMKRRQQEEQQAHSELWSDS